MIAISVVGIVTAILVVTVIILAIIPSAAHSLVKDGGMLSKPTTVVTYRYVDGSTQQKEYTNDSDDSDTMKGRYNGIIERINNQSGMSVLSGMFSQNNTSKPQLENTDLSQYWNGISKTATAEKIIIVLSYGQEQTIADGTTDGTKFTRAYFTVNDSESEQTLKVYLFNGNSTTGKKMITYSGNFSNLFNYVMGLPTGASPV